jgi:3-phosphoshikimate 1-carboxyvinyltransferase
LNVGNAGTVARFLTALLALQDEGEYFLDGTVAMRERPMEGLINALETHGAKFSFDKKINYFPFKIFPDGLNSENWDIDASLSSQILSAILLISPCIPGETRIQLKKDTVSKPFVKMTIKMMRQFSTESEFNAVEDNNSYSIGSFKYKLDGGFYDIEPDATAASYFLSLPIAIRGSVLVRNIQNCQLQGDINYSRVISSCGVTVKKENFGLIASVDSEINGGDFNFNDISDTFLTLAALSPILKSPLKISGIAHTRNQETDRVSGMVTQLRKIVHNVEETEDSIYIEPYENLNKFIGSNLISIETYEDHRFAMSFSVLGSFDLFGNQTSWIKILDPMCCAKTFPEFFEVLSLCRTNTV